MIAKLGCEPVSCGATTPLLTGDIEARVSMRGLCLKLARFSQSTIQKIEDRRVHGVRLFYVRKMTRLFDD